MAGWALAFLGIYFLLAFGLRSMVQKARTGSAGFHGISGKPGSLEWLGGVLFVVALALGVSAPILDLARVLDPVGALDDELVQAIGGGLFFGGLLTTLLAQFAMGKSWRIGVDPSERTELVTSGPFEYVRNPIFAAMIPASLGIALLVPNVVALAGFVALIIALEIQTRKLEEPYLLATHGEAYANYAAHAGRFVPLIGRLR